MKRIGAAEASKKKSDFSQSQQLRKAVKVKGIQQHLRALQQIADDNDGNRASGTPGYTASRNYVVKSLRNAGYRPTVQSFPFIFFNETTPTLFLILPCGSLAISSATSRIALALSPWTAACRADPSTVPRSFSPGSACGG